MNRMNRRDKWIAVLLAATLTHTTASAQDPAGASEASAASAASVAIASSVVVRGSIATLAFAGSVVVTAVDAVGESTVVALRDASDGAEASVRIAGVASVAVGAVVEVVASSTGCALISAGRMIAFIPNEIGRALVHQRPLASLH
ncbi:MAG: hypothetical protein ABI277_06005 [Burkholderiaceae bacterium]